MKCSRRKCIFLGIAGSAITKTFDLYIGRTGLSTEEALIEGYEPVSKTIKSPTRAGYYPGRKKLWVNVSVDKKSGLILGAEIVGGEGVKGRIDLIPLLRLCLKQQLMILLTMMHVTYLQFLRYGNL